jgi:hypothetical protein
MAEVSVSAKLKVLRATATMCCARPLATDACGGAGLAALATLDILLMAVFEQSHCAVTIFLFLFAAQLLRRRRQLRAMPPFNGYE